MTGKDRRRRRVRTGSDATRPDFRAIIRRLEELADPENVKGMARFGITPEHAYGVSMPDLRRIAGRTGKDHALANQLWAKDTRETRILASMVEDPDKVSERQMEQWVSGFDYWEICDQVCMNLFEKTPFAWKKIREWAARDEEYVRRTAFALLACLAWHSKDASDSCFVELFPVIEAASEDERPMVRKAVSWALRNIGKRNRALNGKAVALAERLERCDSRSARRVSREALKQLTSEKIRKRLKD